MNKKTILSILCILLVLVALILIRVFLAEAPKSIVEEYELTALVPEDFTISQVTALKLYRTGEEEKVEISKTGKAWRVLSEFNAPGDREKIEEFLKDIKQIKGELRSTEEEILSDYGLGKEGGIHILIERGENLPVHLVLGNTLGWEDQFIRKEGETNVYLIHTNLSRQMEVYGEDSPKSSVWVDKTILDIDKGKIVEVVLSWPDKKLHFEREEVEKEIQKEGEERKTEIRWVVKEGSPETEFEEDEFENLLGSLSSLDATGVVDPKKYEELGLDKPNYSCQIKLEDGKERKITASRTDPSKDAYLIVDERRDVIYQLSSFKFEEVFRKGGELFSLKGPDLDKEKIKEILITVEKRQYKFLKDGESWSLQEPNIQLEIKEDTLKDIASEFASLEFDDFAQGDKDSFGLSSPLNSLVVKTETGKKHSLRLGERAKSVEGNYVLLDDEDTVYVLSKSDVEEFFPEDREIFNLSLTDISSWELKKMVVQRRGEQMTFNKIEEEWKVQRDGREIEADEEKIEDFIDKITGLEGKSFTFTKSPLGSEEAELIISLEEREGRKSQILFGESSDGMRLLRVDDKNFSYLLNEEEFKDLLKKLEEFEKPQQPEDSEQ